jgi:glycosyltransferase involved in cell wall biosynthesis
MCASRKHSVGWVQRVSRRIRYISPINIATRLLPDFTHPALRRIHQKLIQPRIALQQEQLQEIITSSQSEITIIIPPSLDWSAQMFQRPQQIASALAANGARVFYLQHRENWDDTPFGFIQPNLILCNVPAETFQILEKPLIYLFTWNRRFQAAFQSPRIIYDVVDDIHTFPGSHSNLLRDHQQLLQDAEFVFVTAKRLYEEVLLNRLDAVLCPNAVNYEHFYRARRTTQRLAPQELQPLLASGKPIIGYHGALATWFDYDLLELAASARQDLNFVLIGPDHDHTLPEALLNRSNIHWLGMKPYQFLPDYLRYFDAAMIPFQLTEITHATSPIKLFEYFAAGKPVVITAMQESMRYPGVLVASDPQDFLFKIDQALQLRSDQAFLGLSDQIARQNTWDARARQMLEIILG